MTAKQWMDEAVAYLSAFLGSHVSEWSLSTLLCSVRNTGNYDLWNKARDANFFEARA